MFKRDSLDTKVWTIRISFRLSFQRTAYFSTGFTHLRNSQKNMLVCRNQLPQRGEMSIETADSPRPKPQRGEMWILKIVQSLV